MRFTLEYYVFEFVVLVNCMHHNGRLRIYAILHEGIGPKISCTIVTAYTWFDG